MAAAAVKSMLEHFEDTFEFTTGWDDRHEDWYYDGEMTYWRRMQHNVAGEVTFKFVEDGDYSCCCVWKDDGEATIIYSREEYDSLLSSFDVC